MSWSFDFKVKVCCSGCLNTCKCLLEFFEFLSPGSRQSSDVSLCVSVCDAFGVCFSSFLLFSFKGSDVTQDYFLSQVLEL